MRLLILLVAVAALVVALLAYKKAGGNTKELSRELEKPLDSLREKTAETLSKMGQSLRKENDK